MPAVSTRILRYYPLASQRRFHECPSLFKGFSGPVGSGKSLALVAESWRLSVVNPGLLGLIGAPTYPMLRDVTQRAFFELLDKSAIPYTFHKQENRLFLHDTHSEIIFRSLDNPESLRGTNLAWFGVDELTYCSEDAWLRLQARLRHPRAKQLCGFGSWTPKGFDWVWRRFISADKSSDHTAILASPRENNYLSKEFYDSLARSYDSLFFQQEVEGAYLNIRSGSTYFAFNRALHVSPQPYRSGHHFFWSLDFNVNPMCSVFGLLEDRTTYTDILRGVKDRVVSVLDEISIPNSNTFEAVAEFITKARSAIGQRGSYPHVVHIYGDPAGNARSTQHHASASDWQIVREELAKQPYFRPVWHVASSHPAIKDRIAAVNALLKNSLGEVRLNIDPRCKTLIRDLEQVTWKTDSNGNPTGDLDKSNSLLTHVSDALGYMVYEEFGLRQRGGPQSKSII